MMNSETETRPESDFETLSASRNLAISMREVSKSYKHFKLDRICLEFEQGTVAGLIGPNGAGKTTTMRIMMGLVNPESGDVRVLNKPISSAESSAKQDIGYFSEDMRLYKPETIGWHMQFVQSLYPTWDNDYANQLLDRFGLLDKQMVKGLSHGQRVKAMLLLILARRPKLLILDEPTNGLDPVAKYEVTSELMRIVEDDERTILYSSHNTQDIEQISDTITFIDRGKVVASKNRDSFLEEWRRIKVRAPEKWQPPIIEGLQLESTLGQLRVFMTNRFCEDLPSRLQNTGASIESVESMTLEEIFVHSVMRGREENKNKR